MAPRRLTLIACVTLLGVACGADDAVSDESVTTAPLVTTDTAATDTAAPDSAAPDSDGTTDTAAPDDGTTSVPPAPESPVLLHGDLDAVEVGLDDVAELDSPIDTTISPAGELWVALRAGEIVVLDHLTGEIGDTILDISAETTTDGERGLLGIVASTGFLYINFTDLDGHTNVDAIRIGADGRPTGPRRNLLVIEQPFANHNGGGLALGPDGRLYIAMGDGGLANDPLGSGQDPTQLLGSILRIEPTFDAEEPYAIPADNPHADGVDGRPEIFAIGTRNPWRITFDEATDDFWVADVGQGEWEEIDLLPGAAGWGVGANLGWNLREGTHEFTGERPEGNVDPVFEYPHSGAAPSGCSISGGRVYRGAAIPDLVGAYVFGDFCTSRLWAISTAEGEVTFRDLDAEVPGGQLVMITTDPDGELLTISLGGNISRVVPG